MTEAAANFMLDMLDDVDEIEVSIVKNYSGNQQYSKTTFGIKTSRTPGKTLALVLSGVFGVCGFETDDYPDVTWSDFTKLSSDQLGLGYVIY